MYLCRKRATKSGWLFDVFLSEMVIVCKEPSPKSTVALYVKVELPDVVTNSGQSMYSPIIGTLVWQFIFKVISFGQNKFENSCFIFILM